MKKSIVVISLLMFISALANAQISIMPYVQSDYSHFATFPDAENQYRSYYKPETRPKLGYAVGTTIEYHINKKWAFQTGLEYQNMGSVAERSTHDIVDPLFSYTISRENHHFINIPIQMKYHFTNDKKSTPFIAFGTSLNWNVSSVYLSEGFVNEELIIKTKSRIENPQTINFAANVDIGCKRKLTEKLTLNTFLSGNMLLLPTRKNDIHNDRHFNIGLGIGLGYSI